MKQETYTLPEYWASALINGDYSGMEDSEIGEIEDFISNKIQPNHYFMCIEADFDTKQFKPYNDANNMGGDVIDYTFDVSPLNVATK
jgi:hypothetical protein